jgi:DNA helicase HerA-like ATPase
MPELFTDENSIGVFRGFREGGLEFHADLTLPYRPKLHNIPMHGAFLLVQLENANEAVLGRIISLSAMGRLASDSGEQYSIRAVMDRRPADEELREAFLQYRVDIRVLGVIRVDRDGRLHYVPSHRRLPHVGSPVAFPTDEVLRHIAGHYSDGADLGYLALGEYIYAGNDDRVDIEGWMQRKQPQVLIKFPVQDLVARRSFVFARAGFGKSNLTKLLFSHLYESTPTTLKRDGRQAPVGTVIFDPDGEYFWPDEKGRAALCDVRKLKDQLVIFTSREPPSAYYGSFVAGQVRLDLRRLSPADVISISVAPERQDQQNVRKLRQLNSGDWSELIDLVDVHGHSADLERIKELLRLEASQGDAEALAARANVVAIVRALHDRSSQMLDLLLSALQDGKLCVVDISQLRGGPSMMLAGLILRRIFDRNQAEFTKATPATIPTIAVIEEAQSVLNEKASAATPFIEWIKEGRKYDLGALLITQQPASIPDEILSQGDNWFLFHLLAKGDLARAQSANAHFSDDLLASLLNEPIPGQGIFWSSAGNLKYPVPLRVLSFDRLVERADPRYNATAIDTYARTLRQRFAAQDTAAPTAMVLAGHVTDEVPDQLGSDPLRRAEQNAIEILRGDREFAEQIDRGVPWGRVFGIIRDALPAAMDDRDAIARGLVVRAISAVIGGEQNVGWTTERRGPKNTLFVKRRR